MTRDALGRVDLSGDNAGTCEDCGREVARCYRVCLACSHVRWSLRRDGMPASVLVFFGRGVVTP